MKKLIEFLISKIKFIILIYLFVQVIIILSSNIDYRSDSLYYFNLAQQSIERGDTYPAQIHLYEDYLVAPLYINSLIIILKIYNSTSTIAFFNLIIILLQILILYKLTSKIFSINAAVLATILYLFYINTIGLMLQNYTELFFLLLISSSIYFITGKKKLDLIFAGIIMGAAIAVRPLGWALLFSVLLLQILSSIKFKKLLTDYFYFYFGTILFVLVFGGLVFLQVGKFEYTSTTGPVNLLIGANDDATGGFNALVHERGKTGFIENADSLTYIQKGEFYQNQAINWITENPIKWIALAPLKLFHTYGWDDISISNMLGFESTNFARILRVIISNGDLNQELPHTSITVKIVYFVILIIAHLYYYLLLMSILAGVYFYLKYQTRISTTSIILLFCLFATLMIMITVGTPRYKYPMFVLLLPFAAYYLTNKFKIGVISAKQN